MREAVDVFKKLQLSLGVDRQSQDILIVVPILVGRPG